MAIELKTELPGPRSLELMQERMDHVARGPFHTTPIFARRAHSASIEDVDGNILLDFASGIGVSNVGHTAEPVVKAVQEQVKELIHASFNVLPYERYVRVAQKLNSLTPGTFKKKTFLANSGAEAVENAIKIARVHTGRPAVICFEHAFHGRTYMSMALTYKDKPYKNGFGPFDAEVYRAPFPDAYRGKAGVSATSTEAFAQFEKLVEQVGRDKVAAVIIEPVLGEGGFLPAPKEFLKALQNFCQTNKSVFIADEIQTGFGRTGSLFASEQLDATPDLIITAKGLAGGMVLSAVTGRAEIMDAPSEGGIGGTYGGNPVSCAAALAVFDIFSEPAFLERTQVITAKIQATLKIWQDTFECIGNVRGLGPMQAFELVRDRHTKEPAAEMAKALVKFCYQRGLIIMTAGSYGNVVRLLLPLVVTDSELQEGLDVIAEGLKEVSAHAKV